jgi:hypothetical protein
VDLTSTTSSEIGAALDRIGVTWSYDLDGDILLRFRLSEQPWVDAVFYEFDTLLADFSMRGEFLNANFVPLGDGTTRCEVPSGVRQMTAVAQKLLNVYLTPRDGGVSVQIHGSFESFAPARPIRIKVIPGSRQVSSIERAFPGFVGRGDGKEFWMASGISGTQIADADLLEFLRLAFKVGLQMFEGPFTGWAQKTDVEQN